MNRYLVLARYDGEIGLYFCDLYSDGRFIRTYYAKTADECRDIADRSIGFANYRIEVA